MFGAFTFGQSYFAQGGIAAGGYTAGVNTTTTPTLQHLATVFYGSAPQMLFKDSPKRKRCGCRKDDRNCRCDKIPDRSPYLKMSLLAGLTRKPAWTPVFRDTVRPTRTPGFQRLLDEAAQRESARLRARAKRLKRLKDDDELLLLML